MLIGDIVEELEKVVPGAWAEDWDNVGLLLGNRLDPVRGIAVSLDPSLETMQKTLEHECSLLITHHPLIFKPLKRIDSSEGTGASIAFAIKNGISVLSLHTNWDSAPRGVNRVIADALGLKNVQPLVPSDRGAWGLGAVGVLPGAIAFEECGVRIRDSLGLSRLELHGESAQPVSRLALCGGGGGEFWRRALDSGADAYFTADMKYHERLDALEKDLPVILADHGEMEQFSLRALAGMISEATGIEPCILEPRRLKFRLL
jgi:dinuclear metal center YbgI/SA1388 family protein